MKKRNNKKDDVKTKDSININSETFQNKQLRNILLIMGAVILIGIMSYMITLSLANPEYRGLKFNKVTQGDVDFYVVKIPAINPLTGEVESYYNMNIRNNPKDLDEINYTGRTKLLKDVTISVDQSIAEKCDYWIVGASELSGLLVEANFRVKAASHNYDYAKENNMTYATCYDANNQTVIVLQEALEKNGEKTSITETVPNCYIINIAQCQTLQALERMMVEIAVSASKQGK